MSSPIPSSRFATHPFSLIETPVHAKKLAKPYDQYAEAASVMALGHNVFIRGLNSIYLQAAHISPPDYTHFISYALCWAEVLDAHHEMEETTLFPAIERITGEVGVMEKNVEQHHAFLPGLAAYKEYLERVRNSPLTFNAQHLLALITSFAPILLEHMADEIATLLSLSHYGEKLPLLKMIETESAKTPLHVSATGGTPFFFRHLDIEFEGGLWKNWPEMPSLVWWVMLKTAGRWNKSWWSFAACDEKGRLRELEFLGAREE